MKHFAVRREIEFVKQKTTPRYVQGILSCLVQSDEPVSYDYVAKAMGLADTQHISTAASGLEEQKIIRKLSTRPITIELNLEGLREIIEIQERRKVTEIL